MAILDAWSALGWLLHWWREKWHFRVNVYFEKVTTLVHRLKMAYINICFLREIINNFEMKLNMFYSFLTKNISNEGELNKQQ